MKSLGQGFGGEAPNVTPNREAMKEKSSQGAKQALTVESAQNILDTASPAPGIDRRAGLI